MHKFERQQTSAARSLISVNRRTTTSRLAALILMLGLGAFPLTASAQDCWQGCEQTYVQCMSAAQGQDRMMLMCDDAYDACVDQCFF